MIDQFLQFLREKDSFVISTHIRPDGDALGSQLALGYFLQKLGKRVSMINSDPPAYNLYWLPGVDHVEVFEGSLDQRERIASADAIIVVDTNALERLGKVASAVRNSTSPKLLIDHHTHPEKWFDLTYTRESASSTGELMYELITEQDPALIDTRIATVLYTAIMTDTGSFRYSSVTPRLHRIVAELLERGDIQPAPIHTSLYDTRSVQGLRLLGAALEGIQLRYNGQIGYTVVSQRMVRDTGSSLEETEGFVNYVLAIETVKAALLFSETVSGTKVSFRSKGNAYVNEWARSFGGGGHRNAAGAYFRRPVEAVVRDVIASAPRYVAMEEPASTETDTLSPEDALYLSSLSDLKSQKSTP
ncbi:MAG TPA: bifunctional oligoribonuclease/PAP phosphatase NrnA [Rhodothermales bacterium]|nr:bifunctional oligoribonuclease/PAP phosphatase NrnA [Rhodothermales bacterium]